MDISFVAVIVATVAMFAVGALWFTIFFGNLWGKIHGFDKLSKKKQEEMAKQMGPWYGLQLVVTFVSALVLAVLMNLMPDTSPYLIALLVWVGFALPSDVSAQIFGGAPSGYVWHKIVIAGAELLLRLMVAAFVLSLF